MGFSRDCGTQPGLRDPAGIAGPPDGTGTTCRNCGNSGRLWETGPSAGTVGPSDGTLWLTGPAPSCVPAPCELWSRAGGNDRVHTPDIGPETPAHRHTNTNTETYRQIHTGIQTNTYRHTDVQTRHTDT